MIMCFSGLVRCVTSVRVRRVRRRRTLGRDDAGLDDGGERVLVEAVLKEYGRELRSCKSQVRRHFRAELRKLGGIDDGHVLAVLVVDRVLLPVAALAGYGVLLLLH